jgi:hypothetical protein
MREIVATVLGFLAASIVPPAVMSIAWPLSGELSIGSVLSTFAVAYPFSAGSVVLFGLPAFLLLRPFRPGHWWSVLAAGFLLGTLVAVVLRIPGQPNPNDFLLTGPLGSLSALVFWLIWRPSNQAKLRR